MIFPAGIASQGYATVTRDRKNEIKKAKLKISPDNVKPLSRKEIALQVYTFLFKFMDIVMVLHQIYIYSNKNRNVKFIEFLVLKSLGIVVYVVVCWG